MAEETTAVFDHYLHEFRQLQHGFERDDASDPSAARDLRQQLVELSEEQGRRLLSLATVDRGKEVAAALRAHPLHREVILQSPLLKHALDKPRGYAGDMELMLKICCPEVYPSGFAEHLDAFFWGLPASQAVRDRVRMLAETLDELSPGSRVLNLACGPALEVQSHFHRRPNSTLVVDLVDHDPETLRYLSGRAPADSVNLLHGNAFRLLAGDLQVRRVDATNTSPPHESKGHPVLKPCYDLIYSAGLFDYIPDAHRGHGGVTALTAVLASLLKPGGRLLVGNFLRPSTGSRHQPHHRAMMELYSDWHLRYREMDAIRAFTTSIDRPHAVELVDENGHMLRSANESVIGFTVVHAR